MKHTIELIEGFTDDNGVNHRSVTFGKRVTTKDLIDLDNDPQAQNPTQYVDLLKRKMITAFGSMKMPVALNALLSLDSIDREDLTKASDKFLALTRENRTSEFRDDHEAKLFFGFEIDGTFYDVVKFGNRITGKTEVEADALGNGIARSCFLIGRQISRISTGDGAASIDGTVDLQKFNSLDGEDLNLLRIGAEMWRISFRFRGKDVSGNGNGDGSISAGKGIRLDGKPNSKSADGTT